MSVWNPARIPGGRYALGIWLPERKLASSGFVPGKLAQRGLYGWRPYWYVFDLALGASQTLEGRAACPSDFQLLAITLSATVDEAGHQIPAPTPACRVQIFDGKRKKRFSALGINDVNLAGTAQAPFILRRPYRFHAGGVILLRAQNLTTVANTVQVVLYGVQDA